MVGPVRTGWIEQLVQREIETDPNTVSHAFDRFACHWQGRDEDGFRTRYGPACVPLRAALGWCAECCHPSFLDGLGEWNARWAIGHPDDGFPQLPDDAELRASKATPWKDFANHRWEVQVSLNMGVRDYDAAAPGFADSLRRIADVLEISRDDIGARLTAVIGVEAPNPPLASQLAVHLARQAITDRPNGLPDEQGDVFGASVAHVNRR